MGYASFICYYSEIYKKRLSQKIINGFAKHRYHNLHIIYWWYRKHREMWNGLSMVVSKCKGDNSDDDASHTNRRRYSFYKMHSWQKNK